MGETEGTGYDIGYMPIMDLVWGKGFIAPGGEGNVDRIVEGTNLAGKRVLELGSGAGGGTLVLAGKYGAEVVGLELGADDYISKPFHVREVQARVKSALRRSAMSPGTDVATADAGECTGDVFEFEGYSADSSTHTLTAPDGEACELTSTDFRLLLIFLNSPKRVLSRDQIMDQLNGQEWTPYDRTIDNQVARLRKKIESDVSRPTIIKTVRGVGYMFAAQVSKH